MEGDATCGSWDLYRHKAGFEYVETLEETLTYSISIDKLNDLYKSRIDIANWMEFNKKNFLFLDFFPVQKDKKKKRVCTKGRKRKRREREKKRKKGKKRYLI